MKKLFSFISVFALAATLGISTVSAQKTVATVEKLWSKTMTEIGATLADTRQGTGWDGKVYLLNKANQSLVAISATAQDTIVQGPIVIAEGDTAKLDGTAYAFDDAGNFVMEGTFPNVPSHLVIRKADGSVTKNLAITGLKRTDFINATGDVFSAEGGYVFVYGNSADLLVYTIANGALVGEPTTVTGLKNGGNNYVIAGNATKLIAHHRTQEDGWVLVEGGKETLIQGMEGFKNTTLGGDIITLAGKEFYIYPAGTTNYSSEFSVRNMTDAAFVADKTSGETIFYANTLTTNGSSTCTAVWLNANKIDDNNAYIHVYNADGVAAFKLSVVVAAAVALECDTTMGAVEGAGDYAVGGNATVKAIPALGHSFVCWLNGTDTVSTKAEYTFKVEKDITLTAVFQKEENKKLTLAVNDATLGTIKASDSTIVMGENTLPYGTKVTLTAVPGEGVALTGWYNGDALYSAEYAIEVAVTEDLALTAKFVKALVMAYELNGGVTNDFGWTSKGAVALELQADYNAAYGTSKAWAKAENGYIYYQIGADWVREDLVPEGTACTATGFLQNVTYNTSDNLKKLITDTKKDKYAWLNDIIIATRAAAGLGVTDADLIENTYRKELSAFFLNSPAETSWPAAPSYAVAGTYSSFKGIWKQAFVNPTEIVAEVTLNEPYKADFTFDGWFAAADFSGEKVTKLSPESKIEGGKLYAKWVEYVPTIAEVKALADSTETKVSGVVNFISGKNIYIQDATGGVLVFASETPTCKVGEKIIAKGMKVMYGGAPEVKNAVIASAEAATLTVATTFENLTALINDTTFKYFATNVKVMGLNIASYDSYSNPTVIDAAGNTAACYKMVLDSTLFPVGTKVVVTAVAGWYNGFQFVGDAAGIEKPVVGIKEKYDYPTRYEKYTLTNNWIISNNEDNFAANKPGSNDYVRGMAAKDGIMYFINRETESIVRVDATTGEMLDPIKITGDNLFQKVTKVDSVSGEATYGAATTLPFNDIKFDWAGNCLIGACVSASAACQPFMIYTVDLETGKATELINDVLWDNPGLDSIVFRFDAFGVAGDVTKDGVVMAADATSGNWLAYRWVVKDGKASEGEQVSIMLDAAKDQSLFLTAAGFGTAPQIFPQDELGELFYVDGFNTLPMLFYGNPEEGAILIDDFIKVPTGQKVWNAEGDTLSMNYGHNGLVEFQVGEEYFLLMAASNTAASVTSSFALYKFADADRAFAGMEPLWYFPAKGMGSTTNGCRTAVPSVDVIDENTAILYVYTNNNGYGTYTLKTNGVKAAVEDVKVVEINTSKVIENGQVYIIKNGVKFNLLGSEVK